ncbi:arsenate reductase family protein [Bacteriovorax sp. DB6_IX]|uniref:arsenate reductase family protein n=1 Tax=Bacteriovorax sp. DB6_IX TaxID=1353530 RepID=UPI00038A2E3A|nr:Spx/MgsR family RNA polymerase-binding regulatory protein [Bacteriovorax sp. DB6_IX]EQC51985.1 transcriptional regulator, Spx/MgsR family [Bacteriovorax sp. DB6_IX]
MKVYGIKNCDTVKKALKFLNENNLEYEFIDFKKTAPTKADILRWKEAFGDLPVNKRGTTFRKIKEEYESATEAGKVKLLIENSSAIKRPVLEGKSNFLGFKADEWSELL